MYGIVNVGGGSSSPSTPKLTALTPVGTVVGTSGWTGTGEFNTSSSSNNSKKFMGQLLEKASSLTFYRVNLKLASGECWRDWSAFYDHDGNEYEFFYSVERGLYDGLIPDEGLTLQQVIDKVRWVYGRRPETIRYGDFDRILKYQLESAGDGTKTKKSASFSSDWEDYREPGDGKCSTAADFTNDNVGETQVIDSLFIISKNPDAAPLKKIPLPYLARAELALYTSGTPIFNMTTTADITQAQYGTERLPINAIDNWEA